MTVAALDGVDDIDWAAVEHAYGSAEDVPDVLRDAVGADDELFEEATEQLFHSIYHQGTLYSATPFAVPFLARLVADPGTRGRADLVSLLGLIAETGDAVPQVLADVRDALARAAPLLPPLLDDPDPEIRHRATHLLGNLPGEVAAEVLPVLRARRERETSPLVQAGLLAAAGRLDPAGSAAWLAAEAALDRPAAVRAGALWAIAEAGLPLPDAIAETVVACWLDGCPLRGWGWSGRPFADVTARLDGASFASVCRTMLERGTPEAARDAIATLYERCVRSRSARADAPPLLAAAIDHPAPTVRGVAATAIRDVPGAAAGAADSLAAHLADPPSTGAGDPPPSEERLFNAGLEILIALGDPRWREPFVHALAAGVVDPDVLALLIDTGVGCDAVLLTAVRRRLAALPGRGGSGVSGAMGWHNEGNTLTRLLRHWGPDASGAVPELVALVPHDRWWTVRALAAIGPVAAAAVPALVRARDDAEASWRHRLDCAEAVAAITGDEGQLSACVAAAAAGGGVVQAAEAVLRHRSPLDTLLPALREVAAGRADRSGIRLRIEAARLLLRAGETSGAIEAATAALDAGPYTSDAAEVAGLAGPAAAGLVPRLRPMLDEPYGFDAAALAIRRITGEAGPLVAAVRRGLERMGVGPWLAEPLRELGADAAPLLPELRGLLHGDAPIGRTGIYGRQVRQDEEDRRLLLAELRRLEP